MTALFDKFFDAPSETDSIKQEIERIFNEIDFSATCLQSQNSLQRFLDTCKQELLQFEPRLHDVQIVVMEKRKLSLRLHVTGYINKDKFEIISYFDDGRGERI